MNGWTEGKVGLLRDGEGSRNKEAGISAGFERPQNNQAGSPNDLKWEPHYTTPIPDGIQDIELYRISWSIIFECALVHLLHTAKVCICESGGALY